MIMFLLVWNKIVGSEVLDVLSLICLDLIDKY